MVDYVLPSAIVRNALTGAGPDYRADPFVRELAEQCDINPVPRLPKFNAGAGVLRRFPDRLERSSASLKDGRDAQDDRICLWNTLAGFIPEIPFTPPGDRPVRVLDLACGKARGAVPLVEYFEGGSADSKGSAVEYTGVDIDPTAIKEAEEINPNPAKNTQPDHKTLEDDIHSASARLRRRGAHRGWRAVKASAEKPPQVAFRNEEGSRPARPRKGRRRWLQTNEYHPPT